MDIEWCKYSDKGLPKPDLVIYVDTPAEMVRERCGFGNEIYEVPEFQRKVAEVFDKLFDSKYWVKVDGTKDIDTVHKDVLKCVGELETTDNAIDTLF